MNLPFFSDWFWYDGFFIHSKGDRAGCGRVDDVDEDVIGVASGLIGEWPANSGSCGNCRWFPDGDPAPGDTPNLVLNIPSSPVGVP